MIQGQTGITRKSIANVNVVGLKTATLYQEISVQTMPCGLRSQINGSSQLPYNNTFHRFSGEPRRVAKTGTGNTLQHGQIRQPQRLQNKNGLHTQQLTVIVDKRPNISGGVSNIFYTTFVPTRSISSFQDTLKNLFWRFLTEDKYYVVPFNLPSLRC